MRYGYILWVCLAAQLLSQPAWAHGGEAPPSAATASGVDQTFVGHYYLSGVMETGSELLLRQDGSFEWYISYGALDQFAQGTWRRDGDRIVLTARQPPRDKPLFAYLGTRPWSAEAEQTRLDREQKTQEDAVRAACPFLADHVATTMPVSTNDGTGAAAQPSQEELRRIAEAKLTAAREARTRMEDSARRIMGGGRIDEAAAREAYQLTAAWYEASDAARSAADAAGLSAPDLSDPILPSACHIPERQAVDPDVPESWKGGLAVRVVDPKSGGGARGVDIALRSSDGEAIEVTTSGDGMALLPGLRSDAPWTASLSAAYAPGRDVDIRIKPVSTGIIEFSINTELLGGPPFERLNLRIDGAALLPEEFGRGRYTR